MLIVPTSIAAFFKGVMKTSVRDVNLPVLQSYLAVLMQ